MRQKHNRRTTTFNFHNARVLIVDDNNTNRRILEEVLRKWALQSESVSNGPDALKLLERAYASDAPFSLVLIDAQMPKMDGFTLIEKIKANPQFSGATLMMLSSAAQLTDAERCRELGAKAYLTKPIKQQELVATISAALAEQPLPQPTR